jgi:hypothetical protein
MLQEDLMRWTIFAFLGLSSALSGCGGTSKSTTTGGSGGGDAGEPTCSATLPCGGDLVGTWTAKALCGESLTDSMCPSATGSATGSVSGTITFKSDLTYSEDLTFTLSAALTVPSSCLQGVTDCSMLDEPLPVNGGTGTAMLTCTGSPSKSCACTAKGDALVSTMGAYSTSENEVTLGSDSPAGYCVEGDELLLGVDGMAGSGFVLVKQ